MFLVIGTSFVIGNICAWVLLRFSQKTHLISKRLILAAKIPAAFISAASDDERQRLVINFGLNIIQASSVVLTWIFILTALFSTPALVLDWDIDQTTLYLVVSSIWAALCYPFMKRSVA